MRLFAKTQKVDPTLIAEAQAYRARRARIIESAHSIFCYELALDENPSIDKIRRLVTAALNASEEFWTEVDKRLPDMDGL